MSIGTGATITFSAGFFAEILNIEGPNLSRVAVDTSHMGTVGGRTFVPGDLFDPGQIEVELAFAAETTPPIEGAAETVTLQVNSDGAGGNSTWAASGFMVEFTPTMPLEERNTARAVVKLSGDITYTP